MDDLENGDNYEQVPDCPEEEEVDPRIQVTVTASFCVAAYTDSVHYFKFNVTLK